MNCAMHLRGLEDKVNTILNSLFLSPALLMILKELPGVVFE